jgi:DNA-directed RNA polymerase specialized sigma24 family protein
LWLHRIAANAGHDFRRGPARGRVIEVDAGTRWIENPKGLGREE